jgi:hypothetical protein
MPNLTVKGACLSAALLVSGALAGANPASAQSVHVDIGVTAAGGYDEDGYDRPYSHRHRGWRGHRRSHEDGWNGRYRSAKYSRYSGHRRYRYSSYHPAYADAGPRCITKIIRYYDEFEDASVAKRVRRCR